MCILLNVKKHEKTFALNVDIFKPRINKKKWLTIQPIYGIILNAFSELLFLNALRNPRGVAQLG